MNDGCFYAVITEIGREVPVLARDRMIILFDQSIKSAMPDLMDYSVILNILHNGLYIKQGDILKIGNDEFVVSAVGEIANRTLRQLGHCVIHFDGAQKPRLPGNIHVEKLDIPSLEAGMTVCFENT